MYHTTTRMPVLVLVLVLAALSAGRANGKNTCFEACVPGVLELDFSGCDIGAAEEDMEDLKACLDTVKDDLISLNLGDNALSFLPLVAFDGLSKVVNLVLQGNHLTTLPAGLFEPLMSLEMLDMEKNPDLLCIPASTASTVFADAIPSPRCHCTSAPAVDCGEDECVAGDKGYTCGRRMVPRSRLLSDIPVSPHRQSPEAPTYAAEACADFPMGEDTGPSWSFKDCMDVWEGFSLSIPGSLRPRRPLADQWRGTAAELRTAKSPCLVAPAPTHDGVGSSTIRHIASWIYAEELGCDWVTPDWGKRPAAQGNGSVVYCHRTATAEEFEKPKSEDDMRSMNRCSIVNWLSYFQFDVPSVALPDNERLEIIEVDRHSVDAISVLQKGLLTTGLSNREWDRVVFTFQPSFASKMLLNLGSWDAAKRQLVRRVLQEARENFHRHPRQWYDDHPNCAFESENLNFAVHVRMGDRRAFQDGSDEYFEMLEDMMDVISTEVVGKGLPEPLFHVFSESLMPCPSEEAGLFEEFPTWPLGTEEALACWEAPTPDDCPGKLHGSPCSPTRDGVFKVKVTGKTILLHVGGEAKHDLSCMTQADGVVMGCSTFGQVAGILNTGGISMFSLNCGGEKTPQHYKTVPPLAVAENGRLWVPIAGSWRDPVLTAVSLFRKALDALFSQRDMSV